ncbi:MAG: leucyl/phenylalanyl-tRNA--protein transferase [Magnetococcales bacterium]|nr:leucyl/phenylalanyl-tRNA--protein transferase [Magnetococcales bacterium]
MPIFQLMDQPPAATAAHWFPSPEWAEADGLLAVGGDLSPRRLLAAYSAGIFPWYSAGQPLLWWSPDPRLVLYPEQFHLSHRLRKTLRRQRFAVTFDRVFAEVIHACAQQRQTTPDAPETGTWITTAMEQAYIQLHQMGYAHSVEAWDTTGAQPLLAGGLYGVALGGCFFGESMFHRVSDASKVALAGLVDRLRSEGCHLIDCQMTTAHLLSLGAQEIPRRQFLAQLHAALQDMPTRPGRWC